MLSLAHAMPCMADFAGNRVRRGNDEKWKAWNAIKAGFPPFPLLLEIPSGFPHSHRFDDGSHLSKRHRKGLVTDVSGPQRNACPGTLTSAKVWLPYRVRSMQNGSGGGVADRTQTVTKLYARTPLIADVTPEKYHPMQTEARTSAIYESLNAQIHHLEVYAALASKYLRGTSAGQDGFVTNARSRATTVLFGGDCEDASYSFTVHCSLHPVARSKPRMCR